MVNALVKMIASWALDLAIKQFVKAADKDKSGSVDSRELKAFIKDVETKIKTLLNKRKL